MKYCKLGRTELNVSRISLGTVALGMPYGIPMDGIPSAPNREEAIRLMHYALDNGINLFDTAPNYGISEELVGEAIGNRSDCCIATKVSYDLQNNRQITNLELEDVINSSLEHSLKNLQREIIDIVQIHNATSETIENGIITETLLKAKATGKIRNIGVSVYDDEAAITAINTGNFDLIQAAYSILDQRKKQNVFPLAKSSNIGIINRSVLLKGVLTSRSNWLPHELKPLHNAAQKIIKTLNISIKELPETAIRFCLSSKFVHTVLIGATSREEINVAVKAAECPLFDDNILKITDGFALNDEKQLNPSCWPMQ